MDLNRNRLFSKKRKDFKDNQKKIEEKEMLKVREELAKFVAKEEEMSKRRLKNILESIPEPIIITDLQGRTDWANQAARKLLTYPEKELFEKELIFLFKNQDQPKLIEIMKEVFKKPPIRDVELSILTKKKKEISVLLSADLIRDSKEKPMQMIITLKDISELKQTREKLEESKIALEIKVAARTRELRELAERQEEIIKERTKEIQEKMVDLERFQRLAVGRELKMIELKKEINKLRQELERLTINNQ